ncbi:MAG: TraR/DksA C4-type zinc finger protein [Armatimonadetes bacterium]|nr:TraR/DksA C4-type zinc finger protein [Armatimonadota bacterium]
MTTEMIDTDSLRQRLSELRVRLQAELNHVRDTDAADTGAGKMGDFDPNHPADMATEMFERELSETLSENVEELLHKVQRALTRLDEGRYGRCEDCGKAIAQARLETVPYTSFCITCQARQES